MQLTRNYVTKNMHYKNNKVIQVKTLVLHSVGCSQPDPDVFIRQWDTTTNKYLTQIVIGADKAYENLPCMQTPGYAVFCWHVGNANSYSIGAEMTEPSTIKYTGSGASWVDLNPAKTKEFVLKTYKNAVDIFAQLCKFHNIDPLGYRGILSHSECSKLGIGTAHGDVEHIWDKFGLTMNQFRKDVKAKMSGVSVGADTPVTETKKPESTSATIPAISTSNKVTFDSIKVGDILYFDGGKQYTSADADKGTDTKSFKVKVTKKYLNTSDHPIHVRSVNEKGNYIAGVYGWVDIADLVSLDSTSNKLPYMVRVTASELNIRSGPGTTYKIVNSIKDKGVYTIIEESNGWGKLKSKIGWISLAYTKKV